MKSRWIWPFELREKIGVGGMGVVYRGRYVKDGRLVALKLLPEDVTKNATIAARFRREMELLKSLKHPNIVQCFGGVSDEKQAFYAMELVEGGTLAELLHKKGRFSPEETVHYALQMCAALAHAHAHGVIHRDVKPGNFLLTEDGVLKLSDFGIAFVAGESRLTSEGKTVGSFPYMAPEQIRGAPPLSAQTDLYALGCVLFEMLSGRPPFLSDMPADLMRKHLEEPPPLLSELVPDCPPLLDSAVMRLLHKEPQQRPATADEVAGWLQEAAGDSSQTRAAGALPGAQATVEASRRARPSSSRLPKTPAAARSPADAATARPWKLAVVACAVVIGGLLVWNNELRQRAARVDAADAEWIKALAPENPILVRRTAAEALGRIESDDRRVIDALLNGLKDEDFGVRANSAEALGRIGPAAKSSVSTLRAIRQQDAEPMVRTAAADAIGKLEYAQPRRGRLWTILIAAVALLAGVIAWWVRREIRAERASRLPRSARAL